MSDLKTSGARPSIEPTETEAMRARGAIRDSLCTSTQIPKPKPHGAASDITKSGNCSIGTEAGDPAIIAASTIRPDAIDARRVGASANKARAMTIVNTG